MINIVTAFPGEARPLIDFLGLTDKDTRGPGTLYRNGNCRLVVSGGGKDRAAAATAWLQGTGPLKGNAAWLNVGIAGHASRPVGDGALAHRITDHGTGQSWYPPQVHGLTLATDNLVTVDRPETAYPEHGYYDMEATGFYPVACRSTTAELVQCYKVVSDNRDNPVAGVTPKLAEALITNRLADIARLVTALDKLSDVVIGRRVPEDRIAWFTSRWRFTVSQQHQLEKLLARWDALLPEQPPWCGELQTRHQARQVLHWLEQRIKAVPVRLG
jgi:hypothetical protein